MLDGVQHALSHDGMVIQLQCNAGPSLSVAGREREDSSSDNIDSIGMSCVASIVSVQNTSLLTYFPCAGSNVLINVHLTPVLCLESIDSF